MSLAQNHGNSALGVSHVFYSSAKRAKKLFKKGVLVADMCECTRDTGLIDVEGNPILEPVAVLYMHDGVTCGGIRIGAFDCNQTVDTDTHIGNFDAGVLQANGDLVFTAPILDHANGDTPTGDVRTLTIPFQEIPVNLVCLDGTLQFLMNDGSLTDSGIICPEADTYANNIVCMNDTLWLVYNTGGMVNTGIMCPEPNTFCTAVLEADGSVTISCPDQPDVNTGPHTVDTNTFSNTVDNGDGTYTTTNEDGTQVIWTGDTTIPDTNTQMLPKPPVNNANGTVTTCFDIVDVANGNAVLVADAWCHTTSTPQTPHVTQVIVSDCFGRIIDPNTGTDLRYQRQVEEAGALVALPIGQQVNEPRVGLVDINGNPAPTDGSWFTLAEDLNARTFTNPSNCRRALVYLHGSGHSLIAGNDNFLSAGTLHGVDLEIILRVGNSAPDKEQISFAVSPNNVANASRQKTAVTQHAGFSHYLNIAPGATFNYGYTVRMRQTFPGGNPSEVSGDPNTDHFTAIRYQTPKIKGSWNLI